MKKFNKPALEIIDFKTDDIITASPGCPEYGGISCKGTKTQSCYLSDTTDVN